MESLQTLEKNLVDFFKTWPRLPKEVTKFLADWAWLFTLIGVIVGVVGIISLLSIAFLGTALLSQAVGVVGAGIGIIATVGLIVSLLFSIVILYLEAMAINPLKDKKKKGWDYIYWAMLLNIASAVVSAVLTLNFIGLIYSAIFVVIGVYILFEVRSYFISSTKKATAK